MRPLRLAAYRRGAPGPVASLSDRLLCVFADTRPPPDCALAPAGLEPVVGDLARSPRGGGGSRLVPRPVCFLPLGSPRPRQAGFEHPRSRLRRWHVAAADAAL